GESAWEQATEAEQILGGGLLPGLEASWIDEYRNELDDLRLQALELTALAGVLVGGPHLARAERAARTAIEISRFRESSRVALLEVMEAQGNIAEALRAFDEFRVLLREELGTFPSPELAAVHTRLLGSSEAPAPAVPAGPARESKGNGTTSTPADISRRIDPRIETIGLVGREILLDRLKRELELAAAGELRIALLAGEGGLGKTRVAAELARSREDITVLYGRSAQDEVRPLRIWMDLLRSALRQAEGTDLAGIIGGDGPTLVRILPELARHLDLPAPGPPGDLESERRALFDAVMRMIGRLSSVKPMLIILDDLHWADRSTLMLLTSLAGDDPPGGLLAVGLYRDTELPGNSLLPETLVNLQRRLPTTRFDLEPLDTEETGRLIEGRTDRGLARSLRDQTGGNPFLIEQLVRYLEETGEEDIGEVPAEIREIVTQRVGRLAEGGDELLRRASLIGQDFDLTILERTTPLDQDRIIDLLDEAVSAGLLDESRTVPGRYSFVHALLRGALADQISLTRRTAIHRDIGEAIEYQTRGRPGTRLGEMARHFGLAGPGETDRAIQYAILAAAQSEERLAYDEAVGFYENAIDACRADEPVDHGLLARLLLNRAEAQWMNGMLQPAGDSFFEAAAAARESGLPDLLAQAALGTGWGNWDAFDTDMAARIELLREALGSLGEGPSSLKARVMSALSQTLYYGSGQAREARLLATEAERMIAGTDDAETEYAVISDVAFTRWEPGSRDLRLPSAERLVERAGQLPERELLAQALASRSLAMLNLGRKDAAAADRARHAEMSRTLPQIR
ncbi:MAG: AAA family ATPase, partial [Actinomycetota bacterium]|nr:AAA family ATPase [Actinomycetota bacterium]